MRLTVALSLLLLFVCCGARSSLVPGGGAGEPVACEEDEDCDSSDLCRAQRCVEGACRVVAEVNCDDNDECTLDHCEPSSGECVNEPRTVDLDGDGYRGALPGFAAGQEGACGQDCDDTTELARPGGTEICDGLDNDCNGVIDDGARYTPVSEEPQRVSSTSFDQARAGGLAFNGSVYGVTYAGHSEKWESLFSSLDEAGSLVTRDAGVTSLNANTYPGPLVWTGSVFATAWDDARQAGNYEIYFNRLDSMGQKLGPDLRLTDATEFSLHPSLLFTGSEYLILWDDQRPQSPARAATSVIYGQRLKEDGTPIGGNIQLTPLTEFADGADPAILQNRVGFAYRVLDGEEESVRFRTADLDFGNPSDSITVVSSDVQAPRLTVARDRFFVSWTLQAPDFTPGQSVFGATLDTDGTVLKGPAALTSGATFARAHAVQSLGDRFLLVWADDHDDNYELYSKLLSLELEELTPRQRITQTPSETLAPSVSLGPEGDVGILFRDRQTGERQLYFTRLTCAAGP